MIERHVQRALEHLRALGLEPLLAGGYLLKPARDADIFVPAWPEERDVERLARAIRARYHPTRHLVVLEPRAGSPIQIVPVAFREPEEVLGAFDLGASQIGLFRGELVTTEAFREASGLGRPLVRAVGPTTPSRVLKYAAKGFPRYGEDLVVAVLSLLRALALMGEGEKEDFFRAYDGMTRAAHAWARRLAPLFVLAGLDGALPLAPVKAFRGLPCPWRGVDAF